MSTVRIKTDFAGDMRRLSKDSSTLNYDDLCAEISALYGVPSNELTMQYCDVDGDIITIASSGELTEALQFSKDGPEALRLLLTRRSGSGSQDVASNTTTADHARAVREAVAEAQRNAQASAAQARRDAQTVHAAAEREAIERHESVQAAAHEAAQAAARAVATEHGTHEAHRAAHEAALAAAQAAAQRVHEQAVNRNASAAAPPPRQAQSSGSTARGQEPRSQVPPSTGIPELDNVISVLGRLDSYVPNIAQMMGSFGAPPPGAPFAPPMGAAAPPPHPHPPRGHPHPPRGHPHPHGRGRHGPGARGSGACRGGPRSGARRTGPFEGGFVPPFDGGAWPFMAMMGGSLMSFLDRAGEQLSDVSRATKDALDELITAIDQEGAHFAALAAARASYDDVRTWMLNDLGESGIVSDATINTLVGNITPRISPHLGDSLTNQVGSFVRLALRDQAVVGLLRELNEHGIPQNVDVDVELDLGSMFGGRGGRRHGRGSRGFHYEPRPDDPPVPPCPLRFRDQSRDVAHLQKLLTQLSYMNEGMYAWRMGTYGPRTRTAVEQFQREYGLESNAELGVYDELTRAALFSIVDSGVPTRVASGGGEDVTPTASAATGPGADASAAGGSSDPPNVAAESNASA